MARKDARAISAGKQSDAIRKRSAATKVEEDEAPVSAPAHTFQLVIMLLLQTALLIGAVLYAPQGVLSKDGPSLTLYSGIYDMFNPADRDAGKVKAKMTAALRGIFIVQTLFVGRFKWWWQVGEKIEQRQSIKQLQKESGLMKQGESLVLTTFALPLAVAFSMVMLILLGAPAISHWKETAIGATHITLIALYAPVHVLGEDWTSWVQVFSAFSPRNPRERFLFIQTISPLIGAWLACAGLALDWSRPWQAWPIPAVVGCFGGAVVGNLLALLVYIFAKPAKAKRVE